MAVSFDARTSSVAMAQPIDLTPRHNQKQD